VYWVEQQLFVSVECVVPLLSSPQGPLLQQCWAAACSSSALSAASADVVAVA